MAAYDRIARQWHRITGYSGGAFKKYVLNDRIMACIPAVHGRAILELGAGNGYFMPLLLQRFSGQTPARVTITDVSAAQLDIAQTRFPIDGADYARVDAQGPFPYEDRSFDIILASMVFNEISKSGLHNALTECRRVLTDSGLLLIAVAHPAFVDSLAARGQLKRDHGHLTMPGAEGMRLPVVRRSVARYESLLSEASFSYEAEDIYPDRRVLNEKPGLKRAGDVPLGLLFVCKNA